MKKEYALGLLTVLFWSTSATAFKITLQYLDVLQLLLYSIITAVAVLGIFLGVKGQLGKVFGLPGKSYFFYMTLGVLNPFVYYWMAVKGYDLLPAQIAQPINYTWVITLSLLSVPLLKQKLTGTQILATLVCYSGVVVLSWQGGASGGEAISMTGVFLASSCTVIWALYWIYNVRSKEDPIIAIFLNFLFSIPFVVAACMTFSSLAVPDIRGLYGAVWIGCFEFGFAFITWIMALKLADNTNRVTNLIFLTPFVSLVFIATVLGESILPRTWVGVFLIFTGIFVQKYGEFRADVKVQSES